MSDLLKLYTESIRERYPSLSLIDNLESRFRYLISNQTLVLPQIVLEQAQSAIQSIFQFSQSNVYRDHLRESLNPAELEILHAGIAHDSVLMSYDFHYSENSKKLSLIEINTNASSYLIVEHLMRINSKPPTENIVTSLHSLKESFLREFSFIPRSNSLKVAILDENPISQQMYPEFLMYRDLFSEWGIPAQICDLDDPYLESANFIYNRYTDFLLAQMSSKKLREFYLRGQKIFSPNPASYVLLADKNRFLDFQKFSVHPSILFTQNLDPKDKENFWQKRRSLFFKPAQSFGGKAVYRGESISRKYFDKLFEGSYVAQEYSPPSEQNGFKFDLRFFVYRDQIQCQCARFYKGQVTNFRTENGGLGLINFS